MSASYKMKAALKQYVISPLMDAGFTGKYPHFRREYNDRIELLFFQTNQWGNSFTVEISVVYTNQQGWAANFSSDDNSVPFSEAKVPHTNYRFRLKGMYDGWFYYSDLYCFEIKSHKFYHAVGEKAALSYVPQANEYLVQKADDSIYGKICDEVNKQMPSAFQWWQKMEKKKKIHRLRILNR